MTKELIFGVEVEALPEGYVAYEVIALVRTLDEDGDSCWAARTSEGLSDAERLGILTAEARRVEDAMIENWIVEDDG